jgi:hypothetical protein
VVPVQDLVREQNYGGLKKQEEDPVVSEGQ